MTLFVKNFILKTWDIHKFPLVEGLEKANRKNENGENYCSLVGSKEQINNYLQEAANDILSDRLRTLNSIPKMRVINSKVERIQ